MEGIAKEILQKLETIQKRGEPGVYQYDVYRMVESQQQAATMNLVDSLEEQDLLEQLLDNVKPPYAKHAEGRHYLIKSPFRYPPLKHGSRFGSRQQPSFFYASEVITTTLAECAYYRLVFLHDMQTPYQGYVNSEHMSFSVNVESHNMTDLTQIDDESIQAILQHPSNYHTTQAVGHQLVESGGEVIRYFSARHQQGVNVALSTSTCITSSAPEQQTRWQFQSRHDKVVMRSEIGEMHHFRLEDYLTDGVLPRPA